MTRKTARQIAVQILFAADDKKIALNELRDLFFSEEHFSSLADEDPMFQEIPDQEQLDYIFRLTDAVDTHTEELNTIINRYAKGWKLERLSRATRAVLRCALAEILFFPDIPDSVAVNEAVDLGRRYDSEEAASFVNGILGSYLRNEKPESCEETGFPLGTEKNPDSDPGTEA